MSSPRNMLLGLATLCATAVAMPGCADMFKTTATGAGHHWRIASQDSIAAFLDGGAIEDPVTVAWAKRTADRRLLPLEITPDGTLSGAKALSMKCLLNVIEGRAPRLAIVLFEREGGVWFKINPQPLAVLDPEKDVPTTSESLEADTDLASWGEEIRLPLKALQQAAFSQDADGELQCDQVTKVWIGLVLDGPANGAMSIHEARFTAEPFRPTQTLRVTGDEPGVWRVSRDAAVQAEIGTPDEGTDGKACMKFAFTFPAGRHMYALPRTQLPNVEVEAYKALRFTYKATLPAGIDGLLVSLFEQDGSQYRAKNPPPPSADWQTVTLPFSDFALGEWSRDENGRLDMDQIRSLTIGLHGTARADRTSGAILATDVELVP